MHAGKMKNGSDQRAHGDIFYVPNGETIMPAGIRDEICTPVRRTTAATSGHTVAYSKPQAAKRARQRGFAMKMHAGEMKNGSDQRAHGGIFSVSNGETSMSAGKQNKKCTPVRRRTARASGHTETYSTPQAAKRPCRRGIAMKYARW